MNLTQIIIIALAFQLTFRALADEQPLPIYEVLRTTTHIQVDGRLDESEWGKIRPTGVFKNTSDGSSSSAITEAKITYDDGFIYFAFHCRDENIFATLKGRDEHLWKEEVVEVFLQASPKRPSYIELQVNPLGAVLDGYLRVPGKPIDFKRWNSKRLRWGVKVDGTVDEQPGDKAWSCEIALPFEDIATAPNRPPQPGDRWRLNLYRIERKPLEALQAWSPTFRNTFHVPDRFAWIVFKDAAVSPVKTDLTSPSR